MSGYIAIKCATFNGVEYQAGSFIPENVILPSRLAALIRNGVVAPADNASQIAIDALREPEDVESIKIPLQTENGSEELPVTPDALVAAIAILQMKQEDALSAIADLESENALKVVDACTRAQTVRKAIRMRLAELLMGGDE